MSCNRCAIQATPTMAAAGVPDDQAMAAFGDSHYSRIGMVWQFLPRCPHCKKWVSPRTGICNYARCQSRGAQVVEPDGWPPSGALVVGSREKARQEREKARQAAYRLLESLPAGDGLGASQMERTFAQALAEGAAAGDAERTEAKRLLDYAARQGVILPVGGQGLSDDEAYAYSQLADALNLPDAFLRQAEQIAAEAAAQPLPPAGGSPARNLNDHRIDPDADDIGSGGAKTKYAHNLAAIRLLRQLEEEDRPASPEEKQILARYVGWGGLPQAFDPGQIWRSVRGDWADEYEELKEFLTPAEYESARATTPNAHYTSTEVVQAMWQALDRLGVEGGTVLEPAAGVGHFYGLMPEAMTHRSRRIAVEIDDLSGRILRKLYPDTDVHIAGYEQTPVAPDSVDLAVGNVPFGDYGVYDPEFDQPDRRHLAGRIHNYFLARALRDVKPGGTIAFITSHHTLDAKDARVRQYLAGQADLLGAIRLPNSAFKANAGTEVTTDILFLRKRLPDEEPADSSWTGTTQVEMPGPYDRPVTMHVNQYFQDHPEMMLGRLEATGTMYRGGELTLVPDEEKPLAQALAEAVERLPAGAAAPAAGPRDRCPACGAFMTAGGECRNPMCPTRRPAVVVPRGSREGGHLLREGAIYRVRNGAAEAVELSPEETARLAGLLSLRDTARSVLSLNLTASDEELAQAQAGLRAQYDEFIARHGPVHDRQNLKLLKDDPDLPFLTALEEPDGNGGWQPAALFHKRTIRPYRPPERVETEQEALIVSLNETGGLEWGRIAALLDASENEAQQRLVEAGLVFKEPSGEFSLAEAYLSGHIARKLAEAEAAARLDPAFERNVDALRRVLPAPVPYSGIRARLGAGWIPDRYVEQFATEQLGLYGLKVTYLSATGDFVIDRKRQFDRHSVANTTTWGTPRIEALTLFQQALSGKRPRLYDKIDGKRLLNQAETLAAREMQDKMKREFESWLWHDETRHRDLEERYNRTFNAIVPRRYDGSHLEPVGINPDISLRPHQKNAIWRIAQSPNNVLLGHIVGAGKTFSMIGGAEEYHRLNGGKAMHVVPNHMLDQYTADARRLYPGAKILAVSARDIGKKEKRAELMNRIATGDHTAIIVTHDAFNRIPLRAATEASFIRQEIRTLEDQLYELRKTEGKKARTVKQIEKTKRRLETKLKRAVDRQAKDNYGLSFEDLGLGIVCVDEAHLYKNLEIYTRQERVAGIPQGGSARAFDMYMKTQFLSRRCRCGRFVGADGVCRKCQAATKIERGKVVFATGTPVANTMAEAYVMQKMLDYDRLKELELHHFDNWANLFGDTVTALEMKPSGDGFREYTRWAKFHNVPELMALWRTTADFETDPARIGLPRPAIRAGKPEGVSLPASPWLSDFITDCANRAENLPNVDPTEDNMLKIVSDARKAALDPRLIDPALPDDPNGKANIAAEHMLDIYRRQPGQAQMAFLDISTPTNGRQHKAYQLLKRGLAEAGLAEAERTAAGLVLEQWPLVDRAAFQAAAIEAGLATDTAHALADRLAGRVGFEAGDDFNVYDDLKLKLIARGVPEREIAFIHQAKNDREKLALFDRVNKGEVRFLFGSTQKMGVGTNAQERLVALHHLDAPWRPADVEQREGRILRQGNSNAEVEIKRYVTEGSFDTYMWQTLETKARFIGQLLDDPDNPAREVEDLDAMTIGYAEMKALATGNPIIIEHIELEQQKKRLAGLRRAYLNKQRGIERELKLQRDIVAAARRNRARWERLAAAAPPPLAEFAITLDGRPYDAKNKQAAGQAFMEMVDKYTGSTRQGVVGRINGYDLYLQGQGNGQAPRLFVQFDRGVLAPVTLRNNGTRNMTELLKTANEHPAREIERSTGSAAKATETIKELEVELAQPFEQEAEYERLAARLREVEAELEQMRQVEQEILLRNATNAEERDEAADDNNRMMGAVE